MNREVEKIFNSIILSDSYKYMKKYTAHGDTTCYEHCYQVAMYSYKFALKYNIKCNLEDLIIGALLHDYYLYDWHDKNNNISLHGLKHNKFALDNSIRDFKINKKQENIIYSHMFPLTFWAIPLSKEAWIVNLFDKVLALKEFKAKNMWNYYHIIYRIIFIFLGIRL